MKNENQSPYMISLAWAADKIPAKIDFNYTVSPLIEVVLFPHLSIIFNSKISNSNCKVYSLNPLTHLEGHYKITFKSKHWFLKITSRPRKDINLEEIAIYFLKNKGVSVIYPAVSNYFIEAFNIKYSLSIYPFIDGYHFNGSDQDLIKLSESISLLHEALREFKFQQKVYYNAAKTSLRLKKVIEKLKQALSNENYFDFKDYEKWIIRNRVWLEEMVNLYNPELYLLPNAQCIHGEIHIGNIIFSKKNNEVFLTDFEELADSWLPPSFDYAYLIHRFVMFENPPVNEQIRRLHLIKENLKDDIYNYKDMLRQVCWHNIALVMDRCFRRESIVSEKEFDKFLILEQNSKALFKEFTTFQK